MKPGIPQGTRDFSAEVVHRRNFIFNTIRGVFELYGFEPLETPAMENLDTLTGKYGEEGDKLIYQIRSNKNLFNAFPEKAEEIKELLKEIPDFDHTFLPHKPDKALRYDLTIPFARYVAINHGQLTFPFKRYQMQPVWRGDRPQKGRYREFYQCDADVVGSKSLLNEVELANIYITVFDKLKIDVAIKINSRKILKKLADLISLPGIKGQGWKDVNSSPAETNEMVIIAASIDKLDKIGLERVKEELHQKGLNEVQIQTIENYLGIEGTNAEKIKKITGLFQNSDLPPADKLSGIEDLENILNFLEERVEIDFTLARGLNYYTGIIFEVRAKDVVIGSIGGGGRYDDLTRMFGVPGIPGVGISFGVDRIYDVMEELKLFPEELQTGTKTLFFNMGEEESKFAFKYLQFIRSKGVSAELFHEPSKMDKQFKYALKKNIPFAIIIGSKEIAENTCLIKDLIKGEQKTIALTDLEDFFKGI